MQSNPQFIYVLALCIICGLGFAGMATWLMSRRGNTIKDIAQSSQFRDAKALSLEITDKLKVSTNIPIVAMYMVAGLVAVGLPIFISYQQSELSKTDGDVPALGGRIKNYLEMVSPDKGEQIYAVPKEMGIGPDGSFNIPLRTTEGVQVIEFESPTANPLTLTLYVRPRERTVKVYTAGLDDAPAIKLDGKYTQIEPFSMTRKSAQSGMVVTTEMPPSLAAKVSPEFMSLNSKPDL